VQSVVIVLEHAGTVHDLTELGYGKELVGKSSFEDHTGNATPQHCPMTRDSLVIVIVVDRQGFEATQLPIFFIVKIHLILLCIIFSSYSFSLSYPCDPSQDVPGYLPLVWDS
jgi:hypothetical protein